MDARSAWETVYERFDPYEPATAPAWRIERPKNPVPHLIADLRRPFGTTRCLLMGSVGTGKSTELRRVAQAQAPGTLVGGCRRNRCLARPRGRRAPLITPAARGWCGQGTGSRSAPRAGA